MKRSGLYAAVGVAQVMIGSVGVSDENERRADANQSTVSRGWHGGGERRGISDVKI
jgi:hypothetical protein